ncbi:hypothetical protein HQ36_02075 [Porphyromonas gingivicanis]|uniref:Uncharacterized protein n=1 Tax=Porphyromonas gingivicanis TaxID=266762 RepID=A0A0A2GDA0_9PORP|nr:hypothetical protein HQ36_02075 [Porphyromonas gingivicanis]
MNVPKSFLIVPKSFLIVPKSFLIVPKKIPFRMEKRGTTNRQEQGGYRSPPQKKRHFYYTPTAFLDLVRVKGSRGGFGCLPLLLKKIAPSLKP